LFPDIEAGGRLRVFGVFVPQRHVMTGEWRKLHNEELLSLCYAGDNIDMNEIGRVCSTYGGGERLLQCFGVKT
jgi:hypothetical protein